MYWAYLYNGVCKIAKSFRNRKMRQGVEFATADADFKLRLLKIKLSKYIDLEYIYTKPLYRSLLFFYDIINIVIGHSVCYLVQFYKTSKNWKNLSLLFFWWNANAFTLPIAEIIWVKNVMVIVVCGFLMK